MIGAVLVAPAVTACRVHVADRETSGRARVADTRAADCDRRARIATSTDEPVAGMPSSGVLWTEANEWALATAGSQPQIARDLRQAHYQECLGLR